MAAIDPTAEPEHTGTANGETPPRATLKLIYDRSSQIDDEDDSEGSSDEQDYLKALMEGQDSDGEDEDEDEDESSSDDEDVNGGPSDPARSRKARKQAAAEQLMKALAESKWFPELSWHARQSRPRLVLVEVSDTLSYLFVPRDSCIECQAC